MVTSNLKNPGKTSKNVDKTVKFELAKSIAKQQDPMNTSFKSRRSVLSKKSHTPKTTKASRR